MGTAGKIKEQTKTSQNIKVPRLYKVILYNDDFTTMEFVVKILMTVFSKSEQEAYEIMMAVHKGSFAMVGLYPRDLARTKVAIVTSMAREEGFPLKIEAIPE